MSSRRGDISRGGEVPRNDDLSGRADESRRDPAAGEDRSRRDVLRDRGAPLTAAAREKPRLVTSQRMTIVNGILAFVVLIVILQLWLLTATMNAHLGGDSTVLVPAALASLGCLGLNAGLLWYLYRLDR